MSLCTIDGTLNQVLYTPDGGIQEAYTLTNDVIIERIDGELQVNTPTGWNGQPRYWVFLRFLGGRTLQIPLGTITDQAGWTNDVAGQDNCVDDIEAALP